MRQFTNADVKQWLDDGSGRIFLGDYHAELIHDPLDWQKRGLQQTASGYGSKLTSPYKIRFEGKDYRLYTTIYSNSGSTWFRVKGRTIYVG